MLIFILFSFLVSCCSANSTWLTVVLVDFQLRDQCVEYWNTHLNCQNPALKVVATIETDRFAAASWPITENLFQNGQKRFFTSQWQADIDSLLVSAQIEGEQSLNPFGLRPQCDKSFSTVVFNKNSTTDLKVGQDIKTRAVSVTSQCFTARLLVKLDDRCPHCPVPVKRLPVQQPAQGLYADIESVISGCDAKIVTVFLIVICILACVLFITTFDIVLRQRQNKTEMGPRAIQNMRIASTMQSAKMGFVKSTTEDSDYYSSCDDVAPRTVTIRDVPTVINIDESGCYDNWTMEASCENLSLPAPPSFVPVPVPTCDASYSYQVITQKVHEHRQNGDDTQVHTLPRPNTASFASIIFDSPRAVENSYVIHI